nr:hypothetical protein [Rhodobacter sp. SW2]
MRLPSALRSATASRAAAASATAVFHILKSQMALIGGQLPGPLAAKRMAQLGDQAVLAIGLPGKAAPLRNMPGDQAILLRHATIPHTRQQAPGHNPRLHIIRPTPPS